MKKLFLLLFIPFVGFGQVDIDFSSEIAVKDYFVEYGTEGIEGVYMGEGEYVDLKDLKRDIYWKSPTKVCIIKNGYNYSGILIDDKYYNSNISIDNPHFILEPTSVSGEYFFIGNKASEDKVSPGWVKVENKKLKYSNNSLKGFYLLEGSNSDLFGDTYYKIQLLKLFPKSISKVKKKKTINNKWVGNGSGIIISKYGHILTNQHVIQDADDIEVEFILDGEVKKYSAELIQSDKVNDLAIIKIFDINFDGLDYLTYNFKTRSSDVGTKVYTYGYPMALSKMGKEIKITDGIISSKSGYNGDITTYQITAPIQGGNSGGPLFDDKGNFIGINSSKLKSDFAENVAYSIKSSYVLNLIDVLPKSIDLPSNTKLQSLPLTEQIKEISKYVVLVKVK
jgi:S1-C subfamily serine protease